jgi:two-component system, NarL family, response regulator LiaR
MINLTPREKEVITLLDQGLFYKEIAEKMSITVGNVKQKAHAIYQKLGASNRTEALNKYKGTNKG